MGAISCHVTYLPISPQGRLRFELSYRGNLQQPDESKLHIQKIITYQTPQSNLPIVTHNRAGYGQVTNPHRTGYTTTRKRTTTKPCAYFMGYSAYGTLVNGACTWLGAISSYVILCPQLFARIICRTLAHIVWRKVRRLASIQSPIWNTYTTETREAKLRQCLSPTVLLFDMWLESHIFNKIVTTHNHTKEESVVVIYNLTWFSRSIMVSQCLSWSI